MNKTIINPPHSKLKLLINLRHEKGFLAFVQLVYNLPWGIAGHERFVCFFAPFVFAIGSCLLNVKVLAAVKLRWMEDECLLEASVTLSMYS